MANGLVKELQELKPHDAVSLPARDIRARKAPVRSALIRYEALRRLTRAVILIALDVAGVFGAIWTALELKAVLNDKSDLSLSFRQTKGVAPLAILVPLLLFAPSGLSSDRAVRPGFTRIVASLVQVTCIILAYVLVQGGHAALLLRRRAVCRAAGRPLRRGASPRQARAAPAPPAAAGWWRRSRT